jgi:hypothetical protein
LDRFGDDVCCSAIYAGSTTVLERSRFYLWGFRGEIQLHCRSDTPGVIVSLSRIWNSKLHLITLGVAMTTSTDNGAFQLLGLLELQSLRPRMGKTYFANVLGAAADLPGSDLPGSGLFGIRIATVPLPSALYLLGTGILALAALKRRN